MDLTVFNTPASAAISCSGNRPDNRRPHTTAPTEDEYHDKLEERLSFSHGCIHMKPSERDKLQELKLLKKGITIVIKPYKHGKETYGKPPES